MEDLNSKEEVEEDSDDIKADLGRKFFQWRGYTPIPLLLLMLFVAEPSVLSAVLGFSIVLVGEAIRLYSVAFIGRISRTRKDSTSDGIMKNGPYAYVRNPLYVGNFAITIGFAIFSGSIWFLILTIILFCVQYYFISQYEEFLLTKKFGEEYREYKRTVPAWIPNRSIKFYELEQPKSYSEAFKSEKNTFLAILGVLVLLILLS